MSRKPNAFSAAWLSVPVAGRVAIAAILGLICAYLAGSHLGWKYAPLTFWDVTAGTASAALWLSLRRYDAADTRRHATKDDPGQGIIDFLMLCVSLASLGAVFFLLLDAHHAQGLEKAVDIALGVASVIISWILVQLIYTLRYADLYFEEGASSLDFNGSSAPTYQDFAYLAFTIGMTYQVSDTSIGSAAIRKAIRQHALLSYVFGTAIIAATINTLASLAS